MPEKPQEPPRASAWQHHPRWRTQRVPRIAYRFRRTLQYLFHLLVWSRVVVARQNWGRIVIPEDLRHAKQVPFGQPQLECRGRSGAEHVESGFRAVYDILFANLKRADLITPLRHAVPGPAFAGVYLWDSAFIAQIWNTWDRATAREVLEAVIELREGDRLQHVVADFVSSTFTQPPLVAWAAQRLMESEPDTDATAAYRRRVYPALSAFHHWLQAERRRDDGLYCWLHPYESGVENAPRFANRDESFLADTRQIAAPDFCAYVILQCEALSAMAEKLGDGLAAKKFHEHAEELRQQMNSQLWDEQDGLYYDAEPDGNLIRSRTIASLLPLAAGVPDLERAQRLVEHIRNPASFGSTVPLPSVALDDPDFARDMWRGPVWINVAYLAVQGLLRYGFRRDAAEVAWRLCDGVFRVLEAEHQVYEFYDPEHFHTRFLHRKKGNLWKAITLGSGPQKEFVGWSGLVNTLFIEVLLGYHRSDGHVRLRPCLPAHLAGITLILEVAQDDARLELTGDARQNTHGILTFGTTSHPFELAFGEEIRF
ncbi:MAG: amylo-alpha-1,6-glucosidase [Opitutales bacterium]